MREPTGVDRRIRTVQMITGALIGGIATFMVVAAVLVGTGIMALPTSTVLSTVLPLVASCFLLVSVIAAAYLKPVLWRRPPEAGESELSERWGVATIVTMAIREGAGLFGIVVGLLAGSVPWIIGLGMVSVGAMALAWPNGEDLRAATQRTGSTF